MTKRELILEHIRVEVATEGKVTARAIDLYVSNRVSYELGRTGMCVQWRAD